MSKHTPGPWVFEIPDAGPHMVPITTSEGRAVCLVWAANPVTREEGEATGNLISAAPDLLVALKAMTDMVTSLADADTFNGGLIMRQAQRAIAKAEGRE